MPDRIQLSRAKGWKMPENTVKVDRSTKWGNPWCVVNEDDANLWIAEAKTLRFVEIVPDGIDPAEHLIAYFRARSVDTLPNLAPLRGKNLACWCKPGTPCHADVLLVIANA
jgi:hypothetical protein